jgi:hypothetical protein
MREEPGQPDADDVALAEFLEAAFARHARGEPVRPEEMLAATPRLVPAAKRLLADARELFGAAVGLRSWSSLLDSEAHERTVDQAPPAPSAPPDPFPGAFRLVRRLGEGAFGSVWLADDLALTRPVALKMIRPGGPADEAGRRLDALRDEARVLARLSHPNLVPVLSWQEGRGEAGERTAALVMPYVPGGSLADRVRAEGPLPWATAARYVADVADGLRAVHAAGLLHRDVKPANVLWDTGRDEALLTDFGLTVRLADAAGSSGTPFYMAPEVFEGRNGPARDVYGLAATLFWLTTGSVPYPATETARLIEMARRGLAEGDPRCAALPAALERLIRRGLAPDPRQRPSLSDFADALRGGLNQSLADGLARRPPDAQAPVGLRLSVSRREGPAGYVPVTATRPAAGLLIRDMKRVPPEPETAVVHTGECVRIVVEADTDGFVTVFNVGPTGNLNVLYPAAAGGEVRPAAVRAGRPLQILDIALTPPAGQERLFALWLREARPLRLEELLGMAGGSASQGEAYHATRDLKRLQEVVERFAPADRHVVVLNLSHTPGTEGR